MIVALVAVATASFLGRMTAAPSSLERESSEGVPTEASTVADTTAEMGREHMVEGQKQY